MTAPRVPARPSQLAFALLALLLAAIFMATAAAPASAAMESTRLRKNLCVTTGGGKFVPIPGFPGEMIDRRLIPDIRWMRRKFDIYITDGYSTAPYHARNGEHPIGLALDIVPDRSRGGTWHDIARLANRAEPRQNQPRMPYRWVGWRGDPGHGWGDHLHLSYSHSPASFGTTARTVYTRICPEGRIGKRSRARTASASSTDVSPQSIERRLAPVVPERR